MKKSRWILAVLIILLTVASSCAPSQADLAKRVGIGGIYTAFSFCPVKECIDMRVGPSTKQLPYTQSSKLYNRWCVEVLYKRNGQSGQVAIDILQTGPDPDSPFDWRYREPVYNSDCSLSK